MVQINKKLIKIKASFSKKIKHNFYNNFVRSFLGLTKYSDLTVLRRKEEYYQNFIEGMNEGVFTHVGGVITSCNSSIEKIFGYTATEVIGRSVYDFISETHHDRATDNMHDNSKKITHLVGKRKDGSLFEIELRAGNVTNQERVVSVVDITEQKKLIESLEMYRMLFDPETDFMWNMNLDLVFISVGKSAEHVLGFPQEELLGRSLRDAFPFRWFEVVRSVFKEELDRDGAPGVDPNRVIHQELKQYGRNGLLDVEVWARIIRDIDGKPRSIEGVTRDISRLVNINNDLKKNHDRRQIFWENVNCGFYEVDRYGNFLMDGFNQKISKLFGYSAVEINQQRVMRKRLETDVPELMSYLDDLFLPSNSPEVLFLKYTLTDTIALAKKFISDKDQLKNFIKIIEQAHGMNFREFVSSETEKKLLNTFNELWTKGDVENSAGSSEWQIITKTGRKIYVEANLALIFDPNTGEKIGFRGALNDVTETKMRERKIRNMVGNMQDVIVEFDNKLQIVDIMNPHMLSKLTGYSIEEITKMPYKNFIEKDSFIKIKDLYIDFKKRKFPAESTSIRVCLHKKNGKEEVWGDVNINPIYDEENNHVGYFAVARDVTEDVEKTRKLERMATIDGLTKVYNRDTFVALAEQQLAIALRERSKLLIGFFDIDEFKQINDVYGHSEGDRALMNTAQIISANLRDCDIVGRFGGDEFIVLFQKADLTHEEIIKNKIKTGLEIFNKNNSYILCISMGFVEYDPAKPLTLQDLLLSADEKMYEDKENKKLKNKSFK